MGERERLREVILDLERTRAREHELRMESESILAGLRILALADDPQTMFEELLTVVLISLEAEDAILLTPGIAREYEPTAATLTLLKGLSGHTATMMERLHGNRPLALFDVSKLDEWREQPEELRSRVSSALYVPLREFGQDALIVCTHSMRGHFSQKHVKLSRRFALLGAQALVNAHIRSTLRQRERLFSIATDMLAITDFGGRIKQLNDAWIRTLGFDRGELVNANFIDMLVHPAQHELVREALVRLGVGVSSAENMEVRCRSRDGRYRWLRWSVTAYPEEKLLYAIAQDITESKQVESLRRKLMTKMERELEGAQTMQGLILQRREITGRCSVDVAYRQATYGGGDWFYVDQVEHYLVFVIADVLGHGTPASMLAAFGRGYMTGMSAAMRIIQHGDEVLRPARLLKYLNDAIFEATKGVWGMTCFSAVVDTQTGETLYANGGHVFPLVAPGGPEPRGTSIRVLRALASPGTRIGFDAAARYTQERTTLGEGDKLVLFTDGLVECTSAEGEPFGQQRFMRVVARNRYGTPKDMVSGLQRALVDHVGNENLDDDFMVAVLQYGDVQKPD